MKDTIKGAARKLVERVLQYTPYQIREVLTKDEDPEAPHTTRSYFVDHKRYDFDYIKNVLYLGDIPMIALKFPDFGYLFDYLEFSSEAKESHPKKVVFRLQGTNITEVEISDRKMTETLLRKVVVHIASARTEGSGGDRLFLLDSGVAILAKPNWDGSCFQSASVYDTERDCLSVLGRVPAYQPPPDFVFNTQVDISGLSPLAELAKLGILVATGQPSSQAHLEKLSHTVYDFFYENPINEQLFRETAYWLCVHLLQHYLAEQPGCAMGYIRKAGHGEMPGCRKGDTREYMNWGISFKGKVYDVESLVFNSLILMRYYEYYPYSYFDLRIRPPFQLKPLELL
jgi:hypothetical protein